MDKNILFADIPNGLFPNCANDTSIYTLAQLPTDLKRPPENLRKRARSKWFTRQITSALLELSDTSLEKYYLNAHNCNNTIIQEGQKMTARYCNSRVCNICNRIRTAKMMNGYILQFSQFKKLEFVTLTVPNVEAQNLRTKIEEMTQKISNIIRVLREKRKFDISGIRKAETTYNFDVNTYHPHFHILCNGYGKIIVDEWLKYNLDANILGQDVREATQESLNELFKYSTKFLSKSMNKNEVDLFVKPLDNIMSAYYNKRTFQPFGKIRKITEDVDEISSQIYENIPEYEFAYWNWNNESDWEDFITKERLTQYKKPNYKINYYE